MIGLQLVGSHDPYSQTRCLSVAVSVCSTAEPVSSLRCRACNIASYVAYRLLKINFIRRKKISIALKQKHKKTQAYRNFDRFTISHSQMLQLVNKIRDLSCFLFCV